MAVAAKRSCQGAIGAIEDPQHVVRAIGNEKIFLLRIRRKREVIHGPAGRIGHAPDSSTMRAARLCRGVDPELLYKLTLLGEDLNPIAAPLADVDETVVRGMRTVQGRRELLLIRGRTGYVIGRRGIIVNLAQREAVASPSALESACVHIVDQHALVQKTVGYVDLAGVFIEVEGRDARRKNCRLLVILFHL